MKKNILEILKSYNLELNDQEVSNQVKEILASDFYSLYTVENLKKNFSLIDLTTLNSTDTHARAKSFAENVNNFQNDFDMPNVAAICVYPYQVPTLNENLKAEGVNIASVAGVFPSSQSFVEVKALECKMAVEKGADEVDIVISIGAFLEGNYQTVFDEIVAQKEACGKGHLKVILETGELKTATNIRTASIIAMEAGANFIKTSTGKVPVNATLEAAFVMTQAIKEYHERTGRMVGFKPAGGISTGKDAIEFYSISKNNLDEDWLNNEYLRIGASSLANNLLTEIHKLETGEVKEIRYF
ncbi:deoxyribose-phosphate aldolase [Ancylomarina longa]|uniref:Deoxyribose-phosphate aldolase n=1 Tax=Ancylomarina longa TaxID=2487017 RepID=A0A434AWG1_9BACT|nr:deoxyribose-phosphate aldolase [Ancylomarina longa]RUT78824.1 deoxyribose-phosphate aldolase [Ancylomarina longa]